MSKIVIPWSESNVCPYCGFVHADQEPFCNLDQKYTIELWSGDIRCDMYFEPRGIYQVMKEVMFWVNKPGVSLKIGYCKTEDTSSAVYDEQVELVSETSNSRKH